MQSRAAAEKTGSDEGGYGSFSSTHRRPKTWLLTSWSVKSQFVASSSSLIVTQTSAWLFFSVSPENSPAARVFTLNRKYGSFRLTVIRFESSCSARTIQISTPPSHTHTHRGSVTDAVFPPLSPPSAHSRDDPTGSLQNSLGLQRRLHRWRSEPQWHQRTARGRQLHQPVHSHCSPLWVPSQQFHVVVGIDFRKEPKTGTCNVT